MILVPKELIAFQETALTTEDPAEVEHHVGLQDHLMTDVAVRMMLTFTLPQRAVRSQGIQAGAGPVTRMKYPTIPATIGRTVTILIMTMVMRR